MMFKLLRRWRLIFFVNLYREEANSFFLLDCRDTFPEVSSTALANCSRMLSREEVREAIFRMGSLKSSGLDGMNPLFFQNQWQVVGEAIFSLLEGIFYNPTSIEAINQTLIVLIMKIQAPCTLKEFRPISLCNVNYKIITKVLANRIKPLMPLLVSLNQCSFVPSRHSYDNIVVSQEVIHFMHGMKGKKCFMAIKIDLEKAYDRLSWEFVRDMYSREGFDDKFVEICFICLKTSSLQVLWNGDKTESFFPLRGIRQGDPISPHIFVLCMERLAHIIHNKVTESVWKPITLRWCGPPVSHLFLANDLILFAKASLS